MGEYGEYKGHTIKIGSCESMFYLRPDQVHLVQSRTLRDLTSLLFRFPFPGEDKVEPGDFDDYNKGWPIWGYEIPEGVRHRNVAFGSDYPAKGIRVSLPCPFSDDGKANEVNYMYNGFSGPAIIKQQRVWAGVWATVLDCGGCGSTFRLPDLEAAMPVVKSLRRDAESRERLSCGAGKDWLTMADRVETGYRTPTPQRGELAN